MKLRILWVLLMALALGFALDAIPQEIHVKDTLIVKPSQFTFISQNVDDWNQLQLVLKLNALSVAIVKAEAAGEHPYQLIKEFKKLSKELKE